MTYLLTMLSMREQYDVECERTFSADMILRYDLLQLVDRSWLCCVKVYDALSFMRTVWQVVDDESWNT
jgi:hypothetical protein